MRPTASMRTRIALGLALATIALVCLPPSGTERASRIELCMLCGGNGAATAILNVLLYLPLGAALWWRFRSLRPVLAWGAAVSLSVEIVQLLIPGRHPALIDLIANGLGALLGGLLATRPLAWILPRGGGARAMNVASVMAACAMPFGTAVLLRPSAPPGDYYGLWTPSASSSASYGGKVLAARLGELPLSPSRLDDPERIRALILSGAPYAVRIVLGESTNSLTPVFRLVAGPYGAGEEALQVGVDGAALVLTPRVVANDYHFSGPEVQLEHGLEGFAAGDTVAIIMQPRVDHGFDIRVNERPPTRVGFTAGRGWSVFYPTFIRSRLLLTTLDLAWLVALSACIGWFARGVPSVIASLITFALAMWAAPLGSPLLPTPFAEYAALLVGVTVGAWMRRAAEARQRREGAQSS